MEKLNCASAKQIDLVDYLAALGYQPKKIIGQDHWYLSPLRNENTASFKVNRKRNVWYDHAIGKGGDLIDFGTQFFRCSVSDLLQKLSERNTDFSFQQPLSVTPAVGGTKEKETENKIIITAIRPLNLPALLEYLEGRKITPATAQPFCKEVDFLLYGKQHTVIGFENNAGGFELRSEDFKGSSSPKAITFIDSGSKELAAFEGFFNYLSYLEIHKEQTGELPNFLVLNSLAFFEKSRSLMEKSERVNLYLDRDKAGIGCTAQAVQWDKQKYIDQSGLYQGHEDLNDWLKNRHQQNRLKQRIRRSF